MKCLRCDLPLETDVGRDDSGWVREVLSCRCGEEYRPEPVEPITWGWARRRLAIVRGQR